MIWMRRDSVKKHLLAVVCVILLAVQFSGCLTLGMRDPLPPGQEKKITGDQNARDLTPAKK